MRRHLNPPTNGDPLQLRRPGSGTAPSLLTRQRAGLPTPAARPQPTPAARWLPGLAAPHGAAAAAVPGATAG